MDWHDPNVVYVDPGFKGKVFATGEPGKGQKQVVIEIKPGQNSPVTMDVDYITVVHPDGRTEKFFMPGRGYMMRGEQFDTTDVHKDGSVSATGLMGLDVIRISNGSPLDKKIQAAKKAKNSGKL